MSLILGETAPRRRIVLATADGHTRAALRRALAESGFTVDEAAGGLLGLSGLSSAAGDLVVFDATDICEPATFRDGPLEIDTRIPVALLNGERLPLTALELRLLAALAAAGGRTLSTDELLGRVWRGHGGRSRVKLYVSYLRAKFRAAGSAAPVETVRGFGYRYAGF